MPGQLTDLDVAAVWAALDARLNRDDDRPLALALSGGGDSIALLDLVCAWARGRGRRVLALSVDHGLNPHSADWNRRAEAAAGAAGAGWRGLTWTGPRPAAGLSAAARMARHRLLAQAARAAGARVILTGHTADDAAEADWMRARGTTIGRLRDWSPSPAWPEGRGLMLMRPLLAASRQDLRVHLRTRGLDWIEDPANTDPRFGRSRARRALGDGDETADLAPAPALARPAGPAPRPLGDGVFALERDVDGRTLAMTLVCAGGGDRPPRGRRLEALKARLAAGEDFQATLAGARLVAQARQVLAHRDPGDYGRAGRPPAEAELTPGRETVWDGRLGVVTDAPGWRIGPAGGRRAGLSPADRARLNAAPATARGAAPVLFRDGADGPVLAGDAAQVVDWAARRLAMALDQTPHEADLSFAPVGAKGRDRLSVSRTDTARPRLGGRTTEDENEPA